MIPSRDITVAAAAYQLEQLADRSVLKDKLADWVAKAKGADLLVFPEYAAVEAAAVDGSPATIDEWCLRAADTAEWYRDVLRDLAIRSGCYILTGSGPAHSEKGLVNRTWLIGPQGGMCPRDKQVLTPWERENTALLPGDPAGAIETEFGLIGVLVCYDSEFPLLSRALECDFLLVPSCTEANAGSYRVSNACRARALEGQSVVIHAPLLGAIESCPLVDENHGRAGVYAPCDNGWPEDGIIAEGARDEPGWVIATIAANAVSHGRTVAAVDIPGHWSETESPRKTVPSRL